MQERLTKKLEEEIALLKKKKLYKEFNILESEQGAKVVMDGKEIIMLSSNNYLGLASHPQIKEAAQEGIRKYGSGTASVRFICGTMDIHKELEERIAKFLGLEATLLYISCSAANEGLIPALMGKGDTIFSDELNHASIIDGIKLSKAERKIYPHRDMAALEKFLKETKNNGLQMIITDGVFSMEGDLAPLPDIIRLSKEYNAFTVVDDSHATGILGENGRGITEHFGVKVDIQTGTLGKALGGACGGYVAGSKELIDYLTQKSRPYIFSNALPPAVIYTGLAALDLIEEGPELRDRLRENTLYFRQEMTSLGFEVIKGIHPIIPIIIGETPLALKMSAELLKEGVYVCGFGYPVVPEGEARLRAQVSAAHTKEDLNICLNAFKKVGRRLKVI
jgi:glycine C-acetyltransferase